MRFSIEDAAKLAEASYDSGRITSPRVLHSCPHKDVQAHVLEGDILLLPGSNSVDDYLKFNLRPLRIGHKKLIMNDNKASKGASGTVWHQGFLAYSAEIFHWLIKQNVAPKFIIGHSLGAAAAQILSKSYNVPTIGFAAPRPKYSRGRVKYDRQCLLINRGDDPVTRLPHRFHHMGVIKKISPAKRKDLFAHSMVQYREIVDQGLQHGLLPSSWGGM
ncbi:hypothetical protein [Yoonia sediminilitoris]|uniref:Fungal lipase-like domain-containing protein n=1 Tax=Yoonia sediminilitoris TaxID=1286148 RepID=A0A2T6KPT1_9RHOB|nr:hypothetical protein [Yoonia sediminilitoris]PUB18576.1 hypothetical protein C8N45_101160 [Yoonia sediminilitoris]RCW98744.1 hypothetical protein DFP92_101160 [Yoonia sediminilitoris]